MTPISWHTTSERYDGVWVLRDEAEEQLLQERMDTELLVETLERCLYLPGSEPGRLVCVRRVLATHPASNQPAQEA